MPEITPRGSLSFTVDGSTGGISGPTPTTLTFDFTDPEKFLDTRQTLSTTFASIDLGVVTWTDVTLLMLKNHSATTGDRVRVKVPPKMVAGLTDDGSVAGVSLPATLTAAGYYKTISADGTSVSPARAWLKNDIAIYLGTSGAYAQIRPRGFLLDPGETAGPLWVDADGGAWTAVSDQNTPQLGIIAIGPCA